ncbi:MAG: 2Fe-2S iron-sulfur cluster-binding protein [Acidobacteriota bacterium]
MPKVTYLKKGHMTGDVTVDAGEGESLLEVAQRNHVPVGYACGGNCACSTCHVYVRAGLASLPDAEEGEEDILDMAFDVRPESRLGCQCHLKDQDVTVEITDESYQAYLNEHKHEAT